MVRHLLGLLVGVLVAPLLWAGTAWPAAEFETRMMQDSLNHPMLLSSAAVVMAVGLACGALAGTRISPLAALLPGLALLTLGLWPLVALAALDSALPAWLGTDSIFHPLGPALPMNIALGAVLVVSAAAPSRWHRGQPEADLRPEQPTAPAPPRVRSSAPAPLPQPMAQVPEGERPEKTTVPFERR